MMAVPPRGSIAAIYARYSTDMQSPTSIEGQNRVCEGVAEKNGWPVGRLFSDAERSGTTTAGRSGLFEMLAAAERGEFQVLIIEETSRLARDKADMFVMAKELKELEIALYTVASGVISDLELTLRAAQDEEFAKQSAARSQRGQDNAFAKGKLMGSVPFGYRKVLKFDANGEAVNGLREIHPEEAAIVRVIYRCFLAGMTSVQIVKQLNRDGITNRGNAWRMGAILGNRRGGLGVLRNPIYKGEVHFRKTSRHRRKGTMKIKFKPASERQIAQHPELAIIGEEEFEAVQARLAENFDRPFYAKRKVTYLFTGLVTCGVCNSQCTVTDGRYACTGRKIADCANSRRVKREFVEESILANIKDRLLDPEVIGPSLEAYREEAQRAAAEQAARASNSEVRLREVEQRIANLIKQLGSASEVSFSTRFMREELDSLGAEQQRLQGEARLRPRAVPVALDAESITARLREAVSNLQALLQSEEAEAIRAHGILRKVIRKVILTPLGEPADGRGGGDLTVTVEGRLAELIDLADLPINRVTKNQHRLVFELDNAISEEETLRFTFSYPLRWTDPRLTSVYRDLSLVAKALDEADVPLTHAVLAQVLERELPPPGEVFSHRAFLDANNVILYLAERGFARKVEVAHRVVGLVWNDRGLSDQAWRERFHNPPMTRTIPRIRIEAPTAVAVVIGVGKC